MTITELTPAIEALSDNEKLQLMQIILRQLTDKTTIKKSTKDFDPRHYFGIAHCPKPAIDDYLKSMREGWS